MEIGLIATVGHISVSRIEMLSIREMLRHHVDHSIIIVNTKPPDQVISLEQVALNLADITMEIVRITADESIQYALIDIPYIPPVTDTYARSIHDRQVPTPNARSPGIRGIF